MNLDNKIMYVMVAAFVVFIVYSSFSA